jgi:hypothetical protein
MTTRLARRVIRDWCPDTDTPASDWLADQYDHGWTPDPISGNRPALVSIDGHPLVHRWAMVEIPSDSGSTPAVFHS